MQSSRQTARQAMGAAGCVLRRPRQSTARESSRVSPSTPQSKAPSSLAGKGPKPQRHRRPGSPSARPEARVSRSRQLAGARPGNTGLQMTSSSSSNSLQRRALCWTMHLRQSHSQQTATLRLLRGRRPVWSLAERLGKSQSQQTVWLGLLLGRRPGGARPAPCLGQH